MSLWTLTAAELRERTASADPTPGGGSAACVAASLGLGLVIMALSISRKTATDGAEALAAQLKAAEPLLARLADHADRDVAAFETYMAALRLAKSTEAEKTARRAQIAQAALAATEAPLAAAEDMLAALRLAGAAAPLVKRQILSDVLAGADLLEGAVRAVLRSADINLPAIADRDAAARLAARRAALAQAASEAAAAVRDGG